MLSIAPFAIIFAFVHYLVHASNSNNDIKAIVELYGKLYSNTPQSNCDKIVAQFPVQQKGYYGHTCEVLVKQYFSRFKKMNFDSLIESYKEWKAVGEQMAWLTGIHDFCSSNNAKQLEYYIIVSSLSPVDINFLGVTENDMMSISFYICHSDKITNISDLIINAWTMIENARNGAPLEWCYGKALTGLLKDKKYLRRVLIKGLESSGGTLFISKVLPMLDEETRMFLWLLQFLETPDKEHLRPNQSSHFGFEAANGTNESAKSIKSRLKNTVVESAPKCHCELEAFFFTANEMVVNVVRHLDFETALRLSLVNKSLNVLITKVFILQHSSIIERRALQEHVTTNPYIMSLNYPWNRLFSSPHHLIKYVVLKSQQNGLGIDEKWLNSIHSSLTTREEKEDLFGIPGEENFPDDQLLKISVMAEIQSENAIEFDKNLSKDDLVRIMDIIYGHSEIEDQVLEDVYASACDCFPHDTLLFLFQHAKFGAKIFRVARQRNEWRHVEHESFEHIIFAVSVLDDLNMPAGMVEEVRNYLEGKKLRGVSLPMTLEQLRRHCKFLGKIFHHSIYENSELARKMQIKILNAFSKVNQTEQLEDRITNAFRSPIYGLIDHLLFVDPKAMTVEQFEAFIRIVPPHFYNHIREALKYAVTSVALAPI